MAASQGLVMFVSIDDRDRVESGSASLRRSPEARS
jgi:hypothetical protein